MLQPNEVWSAVNRYSWLSTTSRLRLPMPTTLFGVARWENPGWSDVGGSWQDPRAAFEVNVMGTLSVLEGPGRPGSHSGRGW